MTDIQLAVRDLRFRYRKRGEELFDGLSHEFAPGRITAVTGASGRGKSTMLYVLGLMLRPSAGSVAIDEVVVSDMPDRNRSALRASTMGFVFQDAALDPSRTILDQVLEPALYAGRVRRDVLPRAHALLDRLGVGSRAHHRPGEISGGQAQRVAICRALVNEPVLILADEPTGNLDRENSASVLEALRGIDGVTIIIATHDPFVVEHSDEVLTL